MRQQLSLVVAATLAVVGIIAALSWPGVAQQRLNEAAQNVSSAFQVSGGDLVPGIGSGRALFAGPRIIHVPGYGAEADASASDQPAGDVAPGDTLPPEAATQAAKPKHALARRETAPRRVLPPPRSDPKRTVLEAPSTGTLTPIYPTPRWNSGSASADGDASAVLPSATEASSPR